MAHYKYLIIGGGMAAAAAARGIREVDTQGTIGMISMEADPPYDRPPLSKALWKGTALDTIWRHSEKDGVTFHPGVNIRQIDLQKKSVSDGQNKSYTFEKLLLATGGRPRLLPFSGEQIVYYRTVEDYRRLRKQADTEKQFAVIGAGFIGSEIAAALALNNKEVTMVFPGKTIGERNYPADLAEFLNNYFLEKGVKLMPGESVTGLETRSGRTVLKTASGHEIAAGGVVAGLGIEPNIELAQAAGLKVENGIVVNEFLQTSQSDVYAAGDVAAFYSPALGKQQRVEHEDNANIMGRLAGLNMAGKPEAYRHLPFFYSDLFDLGYEAVGELDARLEMFSDWKTPFREGVVYYLREGRVRGVLLWNTWGQVDAARSLISEPGPFKAHELKGRLPKPG